MKKKCLLVLMLLVLLLTGCSKSKNEDVLKNLKHKIDNLDSYYIEVN